ncbi:MAG: MFS transporter [Candidatus Woesebacteria bacterium]
MNLAKAKPNKQFLMLGSLHILNDGYLASFLLLLPFIATSYNLDLAEIGFLGTILNSASVLLALPAGVIAAKFGGLRTLILALVIYCLGLLGCGLFSNFYLIIAMYALGGIGFGAFHPIAFALIAKWSPKAARGKNMGNFTAIGDVGRIAITTALSFIAVAIGWQQTALLYAALALIIGTIFYYLFINKKDKIAVKEPTATPMTLRQVIKNKRFILATTTGALDTFASASLFVFLPFLLIKRGIDPALLGAFIATFFIGNLFGKTLLGRLVDKFGNAQVLIASELAMVLFILLLANATEPFVIITCSIILGVFTKGTAPVIQTMISDSVEHHGNFEKAFGFSTTTAGIMLTIAPITLGLASDKLGIINAFNIMAGVALVAIIPAIWFMISKKQWYLGRGDRI